MAEMILQLLSIIFMSKVHIDKAVLIQNSSFVEEKRSFFSFVPLFDTGL